MQRITIVLDDEEYADHLAYAKAKGYTGKNPIGVMLTVNQRKQRNVGKLTEEEQSTYDRVYADTIADLKEKNGPV